MTDLFRVLSSMYAEPLLNKLEQEAMCRRELQQQFKVSSPQMTVMLKSFKTHGLIKEVPWEQVGKRVRLGYKYYRATDKFQRIKQAI